MSDSRPLGDEPSPGYRIEKIRAFTNKIIEEALGLEIFSTPTETIYSMQDNVPNIIGQNFLVKIKVGSYEEIDDVLEDLDQKFRQYISSSDTELQSQFRQKMQILMVFKDMLSKMSPAGYIEFYDMEYQRPNISKIFDALTDFAKTQEDYRHFRITIEAVLNAFDYNVGPFEFNEAATGLVQRGEMVLPVNILCKLTETAEEAQAAYDKAALFEEKGLNSISTIKIEDQPGNLFVTLQFPSNTLISRMKTSQQSFFYTSDEYMFPDREGLIRKSVIVDVIYEVYKMQVEGQITHGSLFNGVSVFFSELTNADDKEAIIRFLNHMKAAEFTTPEESTHYVINLLKDLRDLYRILNVISGTNLRLVSEKLNANSMMHWYCDKIIEHLETQGIKISSAHEKVAGGIKFDDAIKNLRNVFAVEI